MDIDIKKEFDVDASNIVELKQDNPLSTSKIYLVDDKYILKVFDISDKEVLKREHKIVNFLSDNNVKVLKPIGNKIIVSENKVYSLYDYIFEKKCLVEFKEKENDEITDELAKLSELDLDLEYDSLKKSLERIESELLSKFDIKNVFDHLKLNLFPYLPYFNKVLSHGDLHPNNILWKGAKIQSIIDWEVVATREETYDLAFLVGCIAINNPDNIFMLSDLLNKFVEKAKPTKLSYLLLLEIVIATRIKWLYKWSILDGHEDMVDMELKLLSLILENIDKIRESFKVDSDFKYSKSNWIFQDAHMMDDINAAKKRMNGKDISNLNDISNPEQVATDLRLVAIDYGMKEDIISVLYTLSLLEKLSMKYQDNLAVLAERMIAMGNSCLDFSKFRMVDAVEHTLKLMREIVEKFPNKFLNIGYAAGLRNASIAFSEAGEFKKATECIDQIIFLDKANSDVLEIKDELARTLSNAITTLLINDKKEYVMGYFEELKEMYSKYGDSHKVKGAYITAKANMAKAGIKPNV